MIVQAFADCVVRKQHDRVKAVLITDADDGNILRDHASVIDGSCMQTGFSVRFPADLFRYALAEALVRRDFSSSGPGDFSDRLPLAHLPMPDQSEFDVVKAKVKSSGRRKSMQESFDKDIIAAVFSRYGECVARTDPVGSRLWILTPADSDEETSRIKVIMPAFSRCLEPGSTIKFGREQLRGAVALNYSRLAYATPQPSLKTVH